MSDFENSGQVGEVDPAADFLSREQDQLGEIGENFEFVQGDSTATGAPASDSTDLFSSEPVQQPASDDFFSAPATEQPAADDFFSAPASEQPMNGGLSGMEAIAQADTMRQEPEKIRKWREEQADRLREKDEAAQRKQAEWKEAAKKELEEWYAKREEQLTKTRDNNKAAEDSFVKERDETVPGDEWQKIGRLCEFNPKNSKNTKDVSRMRSILLQLKQTPPVKPQST